MKWIYWKKRVLDVLADYFCAKSDRYGIAKVEVICNEDEDHKYSVEYMKNLIHNYILNKETYGFYYDIDMEDEYKTISGSNGYVCIVNLMICDEKDLKNYYRLRKALKDMIQNYDIYVFRIVWKHV